MVQKFNIAFLIGSQCFEPLRVVWISKFFNYDAVLVYRRMIGLWTKLNTVGVKSVNRKRKISNMRHLKNEFGLMIISVNN